MKVSYEEDLANRFGLQGRGVSGNRFVLSVRLKGNAGQRTDAIRAPGLAWAATSMIAAGYQSLLANRKVYPHFKPA